MLENQIVRTPRFFYVAVRLATRRVPRPLKLDRNMKNLPFQSGFFGLAEHDDFDELFILAANHKSVIAEPGGIIAIESNGRDAKGLGKRIFRIQKGEAVHMLCSSL